MTVRFSNQLVAESRNRLVPCMPPCQQADRLRMRPRAKCLTTVVHPHVGLDIDRVVVLNRHAHRDQYAGNVDGPEVASASPRI